MHPTDSRQKRIQQSVKSRIPTRKPFFMVGDPPPTSSSMTVVARAVIALKLFFDIVAQNHCARPRILWCNLFFPFHRIYNVASITAG
eukprot:scaffold3188_cov75-Cylindrotheca_fusiformis.AAC.2